MPASSIRPVQTLSQIEIKGRNSFYETTHDAPAMYTLPCSRFTTSAAVSTASATACAVTETHRCGLRVPNARQRPCCGRVTGVARKICTDGRVVARCPPINAGATVLPGIIAAVMMCGRLACRCRCNSCRPDSASPLTTTQIALFDYANCMQTSQKRG